MALFFKLWSNLLNLAFLPITSLLLFSFFLYKQVIILVAKSSQNFVEPIRGTSCIYVADKYETHPFLTIPVAIKLDRHVPKDELVQWIQKGYDLRDKSGRRCYRELGYFPVRYYGYGFWKEVPNFKISDRVHLLSDFLQISEGDTFMQQISEYLQQAAFQPNQPMWDWYLHHSENETIIFFRFHHILSDGLSLIKYLYSMSDCDAFPAFIQQKSSCNFISRLFVGIWTQILLIIGSVDYTVEYLFKQDKHPLHFNSKGESKMTGIKRCTAGKRLDLQEMKKASKRLGCSISHICLTGINIGLEKFFRKYYGIQKSPPFRYINILPLPNHPNKCLTNCWTGGRFASPNSDLDIPEKLEYIKVESRKMYTSPITLYTSALLQNISPIIPWQVVDKFFKSTANATLVTSNIMMPQNENMVVAGSKITDMWFWLPIPEMAMAFCAGIISCNGGIRITLNADVGCIQRREELEDLSEMIYSAIREIISLETQKTC